MSVGDITIVVTVEGGNAKTATIPSATRVHALAWMNRAPRDTAFTNDTYSVHLANSTANGIIHSAENEITEAAKPSTPTYTAAT